MEFEKAMRAAEEYLTFTPRFMDPKMPQGLWFCNTVAEASAIQINAVCLGSGCDWDDVVKVQPFLESFLYLVIVTAQRHRPGGDGEAAAPPPSGHVHLRHHGRGLPQL